MTSLMAVGRHVGTASLAGVIAGVVVGGLLGRLVMRVTGLTAGPALVGVHTSNGNRVGDITIGGTLEVVFAGVGAGLVGGIVYAVVEPWFGRLRPWHGLAYGAALLLAFGFSVLDPSNFDFTRFGSPLLNVAMFAALFVAFGIAAAWLFDRLRALIAGTGTVARAVEILAWLALGPALIVAVLVAVAVAGLADPLSSAIFVGALLVAAIVRWRGLPLPIRYASLAGALLLGAARTLGGLPQLLAGF